MHGQSENFFRSGLPCVLCLVEIVPTSLLQVIAFFLAWAGCWLPIAAVGAIAVGWHPPKPLTIQQKLPLLVSLYLIAPLILWQTMRMLGRSFSDYGVGWNLWFISSWGIGFAIGVLGVIALFAIQTALGWVTWQRQDGQWAAVLVSMLLAVSVAGIEELVFRGFVLTQLGQDFTAVWAAVVSSLIFACLHLVWEQRETLPQLPGLWIMGMVLVLARWVDDGRLGLAWGLHAGLVWAIASIDSLQMLSYTGSVKEWVTGMNGKPLAGVVGVLFLLGMGGVLWIVCVS